MGIRKKNPKGHMTQSSGLKHTTGTKEEEEICLLAFMYLFVVRSFARSFVRCQRRHRS